MIATADNTINKLANSRLATVKIIHLQVDLPIVVSLKCYKSQIPADVKIGQSTFCAPNPTNVPINELKSKNATIDLAGLLGRISIDQINVTETVQKDICIVYLNGKVCRPDHPQVGLNYWGRHVEFHQLMNLFKKRFRTIYFRRDEHGTLKLILRDKPEKDKIGEKLHFRI